MRQGPHQKRGRGRGNRRPNTPNRNQAYDSNGPDVRIRGNANQVHEKYLNLARDATASGDRVLAESYYQHAEHYYRIISAFNEERGDDRRNGGTGEQPNTQGREWTESDEAESGDRDGAQRARGENRDTGTRDEQPSDAPEGRERSNRRGRGRDQNRDGQGNVARPNETQSNETRAPDNQVAGASVAETEGTSSDAEVTPAHVDRASETVSVAPTEDVAADAAEQPVVEEDGIRRTLKLSGGADASERKPPRRRRAPAKKTNDAEVSPTSIASNDDDGAAAAS